MYPLFNGNNTSTLKSPALIKILVVVATLVTGVTGIVVYSILHSPSKQQNLSVYVRSLRQPQLVTTSRRVEPKIHLKQDVVKRAE